MNGKDYHFLSTETFQQKISDNEFVEWEEVYPGSFYGTLKSELEKAWAEGKYVAFDVDVEGGIKLKKLFGSQALSIFIMPPSIQALEQRLKARKTETPESLAKRVNKAALELTKSTKFDTVILNDQLNFTTSKSLPCTCPSRRRSSLFHRSSGAPVI